MRFTLYHPHPLSPKELAISYCSKLNGLVVDLKKVSPTSYACLGENTDVTTESSLSGATSMESDSDNEAENEMCGMESDGSRMTISF